jgi:hypothetical protein
VVHVRHAPRDRAASETLGQTGEGRGGEGRGGKVLELCCVGLGKNESGGEHGKDGQRLWREERERRGEVSLGRARVGRFTLLNSAAAARGFGIRSTSAASTAGRGELDGQCFLFTCGRAMLMG